MPRYFTHYWQNATVNSPFEIEGQLITHLGSNIFTQRGVSPGDEIYAITVRQGALFLLGKLVVDILTTDAQAAAAILKIPLDQLWQAHDHIVAASATPLRKQRLVPLHITAALQFLSNGQQRGLAFVGPSKLDQQTLRGVRELTAASAHQLDQLLEPLSRIGTSLDFQPTSDPVEFDRRVARLLVHGTLPRPLGQSVPRQIRADTIVYVRDPTVKAWVLQQVSITGRMYRGIAGRTTQSPAILPNWSEPSARRRLPT